MSNVDEVKTRPPSARVMLKEHVNVIKSSRQAQDLEAAKQKPNNKSHRDPSPVPSTAPETPKVSAKKGRRGNKDVDALFIDPLKQATLLFYSLSPFYPLPHPALSAPFIPSPSS